MESEESDPVLKRDPTPALQSKRNSKLLELKKTDVIRTYNVTTDCPRCRVPQPPKLYGLPKLHKPNIPMRPIVSGVLGCGSPTYQLSKYLTTVLELLTNESRQKLLRTLLAQLLRQYEYQATDKLVSVDVKSLFTSISFHDWL